MWGKVEKNIKYKDLSTKTKASINQEENVKIKYEEDILIPEQSVLHVLQKFTFKNTKKIER